MARKRQLTMEERQTMITLPNIGLTYREIGKKVNVSVINSFRDRRLTGEQLQAQLNSGRNKQVSVSTVKRRLRAAGLTGRVAARKQLLRCQNKNKRLAWAMKHPQWTTEDWKKVL
uniref:Transposase Tc1-like domain-containing protein n=1 Tax=Dicentrarchus labrax TaxID=13489 RepID=A0A8C4EPW0_DICLA